MSKKVIPGHGGVIAELLRRHGTVRNNDATRGESKHRHNIRSSHLRIGNTGTEAGDIERQSAWLFLDQIYGDVHATLPPLVP